MSKEKRRKKKKEKVKGKEKEKCRRRRRGRRRRRRRRRRSRLHNIVHAMMQKLVQSAHHRGGVRGLSWEVQGVMTTISSA
jgi:hypothetical protein